MRQRSFEIIRQPELEGSSFLSCNVRVDYVGTCPETGISFYCSTRTTFGVSVYTNGRKAWRNATFTTSENSKVPYDAKRKMRYQQFGDAFGRGKHILVSRAVWMAAGRTIKPGFAMDHINGNTLDNSLSNLRCIDEHTNNRDSGFLRKLRNNGYNPVTIDRSFLLRYYTRMAVIKATVSSYRYKRILFSDLYRILYYSDSDLIEFYKQFYHIQIDL